MSLTASFSKFHNNHQKHDSSTIIQTTKTLLSPDFDYRLIEDKEIYTFVTILSYESETVFYNFFCTIFFNPSFQKAWCLTSTM